jgi:hypothetical protein
MLTSVSMQFPGDFHPMGRILSSTIGKWCINKAANDQCMGKALFGATSTFPGAKPHVPPRSLVAARARCGEDHHRTAVRRTWTDEACRLPGRGSWIAEPAAGHPGRGSRDRDRGWRADRGWTVTRIAAFICSGEMAAAYFMFHAPNSFWPAVNQGDAAILFCFVFLYLAFAGAGAWSIDAAVSNSQPKLVRA